jgi:fibronectin-binding autotransporter adhesin
VTLRDGSHLGGLAGQLDGGSGANALLTDIATDATLGGVAHFRALTKTNVGTLHVDGMAGPAFETIDVVAGTLAVGSDGAIAGPGGGVAMATTIAAGATLSVEGAYGCNDGDDALDVVGTLAGPGTIDLCAGDDTLLLHDDTQLDGIVAGGGHVAGDAVVLDVAGARAFDAARIRLFEVLRKTGGGAATLLGMADFASGTTLDGGVLDVGGTLATPTVAMEDGTTLDVHGALDGGAGSAALLSGLGDNAVLVRVGAAAHVEGDLGDGDDTLAVGGTLDVGASALSLGAGDDLFLLGDAAAVTGVVDGGDGDDTLQTHIATTATLGGALGFDALLKTGAGVLHVDGPAPSTFGVVNVQDGTVHVGADGALVEVAALTVGEGARLEVDGGISGTVGDDLMDIAGQVAGVGAVGLGAGNDSLLLHGSGDTKALAHAIDGGDGIDVIDVQVDAGTHALGATLQFEALRKDGDGTLSLAANEAFDALQVFGGTLAIEAGAVLSSRDTLLADGTMLRIDGAFTGTDGDDTFQAAGAIVGALAFGAGDDRIDISGPSLAGLVELDGGAGRDEFAMHGMTMSGMPTLAGMERVALLDGSTLGLSQAIALGGGVLSIDATSLLEAGAGARIAGSVENAGTLAVGSNRLALEGDYTGQGDATLTVVVSAGAGVAGGLDIAGDVHGTTRIRFDNDGSRANGVTSIEVIHSPHDVAGEGAFVPAETRDDIVRLSGSMLNWVFAHGDDGNWYLNAQDAGDAPALLPEIPAYGALSTIGALASRASSAMALGHAENACDGGDARPARAGASAFGDCASAWAAASVDEVRVGADPGAAFSGDRHGLYLGANVFGYGDAESVWRGGVFVGLQRGNDWTTGAASGASSAVDGANVRSESHAFGAYASAAWASGWHLEGATVGQLNEATVVAADGFSQDVVGESLSLDMRAGRAFTTDAGWTFDPRVQLGVVGLRWRDLVDASGKQVLLAGDVLATARAEFHAERTFATAGGMQWRPWATLGIEDTFGDGRDALHVVQDDVAQAFPNHATGTGATLDLGLEVRASASVSLFGSASWGTSLSGTDIDRRQATIGGRLRW